MYILERVPDLGADAAGGLCGGDLELDLEEVEGVHAEGVDDAGADACGGMVLGEGA